MELVLSIQDKYEDILKRKVVAARGRTDSPSDPHDGLRGNRLKLTPPLVQ